MVDMPHDVELKDHFKSIVIESNEDLDSTNPVITRINTQIDAINGVKSLDSIAILLTAPTTVTMDITFADGKVWNSILTVVANAGEFTTGIPALLPEKVILPVTNLTQTLTQQAFIELKYTKITVDYY